MAPQDPVFDLERARRDTPALARRIHLDHAGASPMPEPVYRRVVAHLDLERELGGYAAKRRCEDELEGLYQSAANVFGARPEEWAFVENATRGWDMAFYGLRFAPGDRILTTRAEYSSNYLAFLQVSRRHRVEVEVIPDGEDGTVDIGRLADRLDDRVRLVNLCHVPTSNGLVNPAEAVGRLLEGYPALYFLDACQSAGQLVLDVERLRCDVLTTTGRKFLRGPRGTGLLWVRSSRLDAFDPPFVDIHAARWRGVDSFEYVSGSKRFENWERNVAGQLGLKAALDYYAEMNPEAIEARVCRLAEFLRERLAAVPGVRILDRGTRRSAIVAFTVRGWNAVELRDRLEARDVFVSAQALEDAWLDLDGVAPDLVRASVHCCNTKEELETMAERLESVLGEGTA